MSKLTVRQIGDLIQKSATDKAVYTRIWDLCYLFTQGRQHLAFDKTLQKYVKPQNRRGALTVNRLLNIYRTVSAKLLTVYPGVGVMPASPSSEDISKAEMSEEALQYYFHNDRLKETINKHIEYLCITGTSGFHTFFSEEDDRAKTVAVSPYDIFVESGADTIEESRFVSIRTFAHIDAVKETYPGKLDTYDVAIADNTHKAGGNVSLDGRVELHEVYLDDGRHMIIMGDELLYEGTWEGEHPVHIARYTPLDGRFWGVGLIEPLLELQSLYNKARSQVIHNVELMSNPKWLIPKTAGVSVDAIKGRPGEKVYYNPAGGTPQQLPTAPLPGYVLDNIQRIQTEMNDVSGIHNTALGKRATGVTSGKAIEALASQSIGQLQLTQENIENAVRGIFVKVLELMKKYYTEPRMIGMFDGAGKAIFRSISGTSLVDSPDVFIQASSLFQDNKESRDKQVLELLQLGLIEKAEAMRELSFKTGTSYRLKKATELSHAREMLAAVIAGNEIEILANDDQDAFKQVFGEFIRSSDYYQLEEELQDTIADIMNALLVPYDDKTLAAMRGKAFVYPRPEAVQPQAPPVPTDPMAGQAPIPGAEAQMIDPTEALLGGQGQ